MSILTIEMRIKALVARGIVLEPTEKGWFRARRASLLTDDDRAFLHERAAEVLEHLSRPPETPLLTGLEPWDRGEAIRLMAAADELPSHTGVSGANPYLQRAAEMVVSAYLTRDLETVRYAVAEFAVEVRRVASCQRRNPAAPRVTPGDHE